MSSSTPVAFMVNAVSGRVSGNSTFWNYLSPDRCSGCASVIRIASAVTYLRMVIKLIEDKSICPPHSFKENIIVLGLIKKR